jgi:pSer/pThr/pTyr-binding forkhead associated (FHA) protein
MTIPDSSISRRHAEIQRESSGQFVVYDRGSSNGVYVNNKKISQHLLQEGEIIEIGDVFFRFTQNPLDYQYADDTEMMNTRAPDNS